MPYSKVGASTTYSLPMRIKIVLVFTILLFPALSLVCEGLKAGATDGADSSLRDARKQGFTILLSSRSRFAGAIQIDNDGEEITEASFLKASKRQHLRKLLARRLQDVSDGKCNAVAVATRFISAQLRRQMGPANDPARSRPVKALFILCAKKKVGVRVAMTAPNQHVVPFRINHRRALKQFPPLPFTRPPAPPRFQFPPLPFIPPASPRFRLPPLPFTLPPLVNPQLQAPPLPISLPQVSPLPFTLPGTPLPKSVSGLSFPPLPFQLPPIPCIPSSSANSLPAP